MLGSRTLVPPSAAIAVAPPPANGEQERIAEYLATVQAAFRNRDPAERTAGLEIVMLGGMEMAMADPGILQQVADLLSDGDADVRRMAFLALDQLENELSRPATADELESEQPGLIDRGVTQFDLGSAKVEGADYALLDRIESYNRKMPCPEAMKALSTVLLGTESAGRMQSETYTDVAELRKSGVAKELVPHLADAVRGSREAPIREAAVDALMRLGKPQATPSKPSIGERVEVLRTDGSWSRATIARVIPAHVTVTMEDGSFKELPPGMAENHIRFLRSEEVLRPQVGESSDLELRSVAMDGLSAGLKARNNHLLNELDELFAEDRLSQS